MAHEIIIMLSLLGNEDRVHLIRDVAEGRRETLDLEGIDRRSGEAVTVRIEQ